MVKILAENCFPFKNESIVKNLLYTHTGQALDTERYRKNLLGKKKQKRVQNSL